MDAQITRMIQESLHRIESKVDKTCDKLDTYSLACTQERTEFDGRIKALESFQVEYKEGKKQVKNHIYNVIEKIAIYIVGAYLIGKEALAHF